MSIPSSTPSNACRQPPRRVLRRASTLAAALAALAAPAAGPAYAQHVVFDPRNHLENALQAARQLESLANEARGLAASPYSHLEGADRSLRDMAELARAAEGLAGSVEDLERQFRDLYPDHPDGSDLGRLLERGRARGVNARRTAEDLARAAAELERMAEGRTRRLSGALAASESAVGQTAATQASGQLLAVLAEDLAALRAILLAQSRMMAEAGARQAADRSAADAARTLRWRRSVDAPPPPRFDPLRRADD